jgi:DUF1680 family protein
MKQNVPFQIRIRKPVWAKSILTNEKYHLDTGLIVIDRTFANADRIELEFPAEVMVKEDLNHEKYFSFGALVFARPVSATEQTGRVYAPGFEDLMYKSNDSLRYQFVEDHKAKYKDGKIRAYLKNKDTQLTEQVDLIPFGKTILRQASF